MSKKSNIELTVKEASAFLGVTPRSIINYINAKELVAIKVGKSWYIKEPSLIAFGKKYGLEGSTKKPEGLSEEAVNVKDDSDFAITAKGTSLNLRKNQKKNKYIVNTLKLYEIAHQAFSMPKWRELEKRESRAEVELRLESLKLDALELIGSGYFTFNKMEKRNLYNRSREKVGAILALLYLGTGVKEEWTDEIYFMENQLLAAYSSLIRKMEKRNEK